MLLVVKRYAVALLSACQKRRISAAPDRRRFGTEHGSQLELAAAQTALGHAHDPVDASPLVITSIAAGIDVLNERVSVQHEHPGPAMTHQTLHRRRIG